MCVVYLYLLFACFFERVIERKKNPCDIVIECNRRVDDGQEGFQLGLRVHQLHHHDGTPHALLRPAEVRLDRVRLQEKKNDHKDA